MNDEIEQRHHKVRIHIDRKPHESPSPTTGAELYMLGHVPDGRELFREERGDHEDKPVPRGHEELRLTEDEHFYSSDPHGEEGSLVTISVNSVDRKIDRGRETVVQIKDVGKVPLADDLEQIVDGKLLPLPDDGSVEICGGEKFVSHPKDSGSSNH